jgi:hypothetical protein
MQWEMDLLEVRFEREYSYIKAFERGLDFPGQINPGESEGAISVVNRPRIMLLSDVSLPLPTELWVQVLTHVAETEGGFYVWQQYGRVSQVLRYAVLKVFIGVYLPSATIEFARNSRMVARMAFVRLAKQASGSQGHLWYLCRCQRCKFGLSEDRTGLGDEGEDRYAGQAYVPMKGGLEDGRN